jgi:hypothetical protein
MTGRRSPALLALLTLVLVGCGGTAREPIAPSPVGLSQSEAPAVFQPRSVDSVYPSPCTTLLSGRELAALDIDQRGRSRSYFTISECAWTTRSDDRLRVGVDITRNLLVDSYRALRPALFVPVEIEGAPAVRQRLSLGTNTCNVTVALAANQSLEVDWTGHRPPSAVEDPCAKAEEAIALVVRKLPPLR